jgi:hypothetical protein
MTVVHSWDLGAGGGSLAEDNPTDPKPILLTLPRGPTEEYDPGEDTHSISVDLWGLDPRIAVALAWCRQADPSKGDLTVPPKASLTATIKAYQMIRVGGEAIQGAELPAAQLFYNGGTLDATEEDGCEIESSIQGVRFTVTATAAAAPLCWTHLRILMMAVARPKMPLTCPDLFKALKSRLTLTRQGAPIKFSGTYW